MLIFSTFKKIFHYYVWWITVPGFTKPPQNDKVSVLSY